VSFLWRTAIPAGHVTVIYGPPATGKSSLMVGLSVAIAAGVPFLDAPVVSGRVLIVDAELTAGIVADMAMRASAGLGIDVPDDLHYERLNGSVAQDGTRKYLREVAAELQPDVLCLDAFTSATLGADLMTVGDVGSIIAFLRELAPTSILLDHQSKPQPGMPRAREPFGSMVKGVMARSSLLLESGRTGLVLEQRKSSFAPLMAPLAFDIDRADSAMRFVHHAGQGPAPADGDSMRRYPFIPELVVALTSQAMTTPQAADAIGRKAKSVGNALTILRRSGQVDRSRDGLWFCNRLVGDENVNGLERR
jgi:hypothetical protein